MATFFPSAVFGEIGVQQDAQNVGNSLVSLTTVANEKRWKVIISPASVIASTAYKKL